MCRACSSCGYRATTTWIDHQLAILPDTPWQHITFTLPDTLWPLFWLNRSLLNEIGKIATDILQSVAKKKSLKVGIFLAIHTFGRNLKRNVHIHLSATLGGITSDLQQWKSLYFHQQSLMKPWRYHIIAWLRRAANDDNFSLPQSLQSQPGQSNRFASLLDKLSTAYWHVYCQKPSKNHHQNVKYIGRHLRRPPIAQSKLMHYNGQGITFRYLDHYSKSYRAFRCSTQQFISRFVCHIPDKYFRMIRYYGFLSHALRGKLLPIVNHLLRQNQPTKPTTTWPEQMVLDFG